VHYRSLFKNAELKLQITDGCGNAVFASSDALPLAAGQWEQLKDGGGRVHVDKNTLLLKSKISGGYAVWQEDVSFITKIKEEIAAKSRLLETANVLLSNEAREKERDAQVIIQAELFAAFEKDIAFHERRLAGLLESVPGDALHLKKAAMLACYIKRRCHLLYLTMDGQKTVSYNEFVVYVDELAEFARMIGIQCPAYCNLTGEISLEQVMLFYDFWASFLEWAAENNENSIVSQTISENGRLTMRLATGINAMSYDLPEKTARELRAAGGTIEKTLDTEVGFAVLRLSFNEGGERGD
jgi:hypothetical protein